MRRLQRMLGRERGALADRGQHRGAEQFGELDPIVPGRLAAPAAADQQHGTFGAGQKIGNRVDDLLQALRRIDSDAIDLGDDIADPQADALGVDMLKVEDIMVVGQTPVVPGAIIRARPIGTLMMTDEAGGDEKVLAVPVDALHPSYTGVDSWRSLPGILTEQIAHFFQHYKDLEKGKSVKITGWAEPEQTADLIRAAIQRYKDAG